MKRLSLFPRLLTALCLTAATTAAARAAADSEIPLREGVAVRLGGRAMRTPFRIDAVESLMVNGRFSPPRAGDTIPVAGGSKGTWETVVARPDGSFTNSALRGGYVYLPYVAEADGVMLLKATGHNMVYVNGEPRTGDPYSNGSTALPIRVRRGTNDFLFSVGRGALRVRLAPVTRPQSIDLRDTTLPDVIAGVTNNTWGAVIVVNSTPEPVSGLVLSVTGPEGGTIATPVPPMLPLSTRKVGFPVRHTGVSETNRIRYALRLTRGPDSADGAGPLDTTEVFLRLRRADQTHRETFVSWIDGSVQYYGVTPAQPLVTNPPPLALVLSTHGASVEAEGQAAAYANKTWAHIVAPSNRRPYGFDWEDWGRWDALEVLELARKKYGTDPAQTYLTGHSMGGHGTWTLGATFPDHFAALGPSAGWISFFSYGGGRRFDGTNELLRLIQRAATPSDTLALASNYLHHGIYILHGDADDNVPVSEARTMRGVLEKFHRDFAWHEQPGAGHWWGNQCVDWPPIFDLFARRKIPSDESVRAVHFTTANPGISASSHWVAIEAQERHLGRSTVDARWNPDQRRFTAATENVTRLAFTLDHVRPGPAPVVEINGRKLTNVTVNPGDRKVWFARGAEGWAQVPAPPPAFKGPHRYGPFKEAFLHRMLFVYGTHGTPEENAWALAKARFDAEAFWYRGNGSIDVVADTDFNPDRERDRGVIVYGNADNNSAWPALLGGSPVQVRRGGVRIGQREVTGGDLACLFLRPRPGSDVACVGVVAGTGITGLRLTDRVPYFLAGVAFPDCTVFGADSLVVAGEGARAAGFFGEDWSVERGEFVWRDAP